MGHRSLHFIFFIQVSVTCLSGYPVENAPEAVEYLKKFGYVGRAPRVLEDTGLTNPASDDKSTATKALKMFQHVMHINESGILDNKTLKMMNAKRCGNPDLSLVLTPSRQKRFELNPDGRKWAQTEITYRITRYPSDTSLNRHIINHLTTSAFQMWEDAANSILRFTNSTDLSSHPDVADIDIRFVTGDHNDNSPFDGPGETLAHAFPPGEGLYGDIHVDEEEDWDLEGKFNGSNYFWVIIHEIGHSLGLSHSMATDSIMMAIEPDFDPYMKLHDDDKQGLRKLYSIPEPMTTEKINNADINEKENEIEKAVANDIQIHPRRNFERRCGTRPVPCSKDFRISAATVLENGQIYLFSGCYAIEISDTGNVMSIVRTQGKFKALIGDGIDAAITTRTGHTYFFEGENYRRYSNFIADHERGRSLFNLLERHELIDAGFHWKNRIYLIQGKTFFFLDSTGRHRSTYKLISTWGVPDEKIDAALVVRDHLYLFSGTHFWTLEQSNGDFQVDQPTPRSIRTEFLHCEE
ncbi:unnamed protein product [Allacma fusca]|uniref:Peptidase metallopeptidase domain-containing protein n=1 Tax=Allacma fusca TaxID=39272 RepID=A0A8J2KEV3_9HEXA|nr:unnamed protein product [Allacma fusca]